MGKLKFNQMGLLQTMSIGTFLSNDSIELLKPRISPYLKTSIRDFDNNKNGKNPGNMYKNQSLYALKTAGSDILTKKDFIFLKNNIYLDMNEHEYCKSKKINVPNNKKEADEGELGELFCVCRRPDDGIEAMLMCDKCLEWYHPKCIRMTPQEFQKLRQENNEWQCRKCLQKGYRTFRGDPINFEETKCDHCEKSFSASEYLRLHTIKYHNKNNKNNKIEKAKNNVKISKNKKQIKKQKIDLKNKFLLHKKQRKTNKKKNGFSRLTLRSSSMIK